MIEVHMGDNVDISAVAGAAVACLLLITLIRGEIRLPQLVTRQDQPTRYWAAVVAMAAAIILLVLSKVVSATG